MSWEPQKDRPRLESHDADTFSDSLTVALIQASPKQSPAFPEGATFHLTLSFYWLKAPHPISNETQYAYANRLQAQTNVLSAIRLTSKQEVGPQHGKRTGCCLGKGQRPLKVQTLKQDCHYPLANCHKDSLGSRKIIPKLRPVIQSNIDHDELTLPR